jgi:integrase
LLKTSSTRDEETGIWTARSRYYDAHAQRHDIKRSGRTAGAAKLALQTAVGQAQEDAINTSQQETEPVRGVGLTVRELGESWLETRKPAPLRIDRRTQAGATPTTGIRVQTWESYESNLRQHVLPALGEIAVVDLTTPDCEKAIHRLYNKETGTGYRTAATARQVLQQVMDYAVRQGHRPDNPVRPVSRVPAPRSVPESLSKRTVKAVHDAVRPRQKEPGVGGPKPTSRLADIVLVLFATGMRIGEALAIRWEDVDVTSKPILITVSGTLVEKKGAFFRQGYGKTSNSLRTFQLTDGWICEMILRRHANRQETPTNAVFATRNGTFMRPSNLRDDLKRALGAAGVTEKVTPHAFRRTVATEISEHFGDKASSLQLGHSSPETTRKHYIQRSNLVPDYSSGLTGMAPD